MNNSVLTAVKHSPTPRRFLELTKTNMFFFFLSRDSYCTTQNACICAAYLTRTGDFSSEISQRVASHQVPKEVPKNTEMVGKNMVLEGFGPENRPGKMARFCLENRGQGNSKMEFRWTPCSASNYRRRRRDDRSVTNVDERRPVYLDVCAWTSIPSGVASTCEVVQGEVEVSQGRRGAPASQEPRVGSRPRGPTDHALRTSRDSPAAARDSRVRPALHVSASLRRPAPVCVRACAQLLQGLWMSNARLHHRGSKLDPRSTQKTVAPFEFKAGLEIEMKFISNHRNWRFLISIGDQQPFYIYNETYAYFHDAIYYEPIAKFASHLIPIFHFGAKIDESEIHNHEISLMQHFSIGTTVRMNPGSELGSFDLGSGKMLVQLGISEDSEGPVGDVGAGAKGARHASSVETISIDTLHNSCGSGRVCDFLVSGRDTFLAPRGLLVSAPGERAGAVVSKHQHALQQFVTRHCLHKDAVKVLGQRICGGHGGLVVSLLASHVGEPGSIPDGVTPGFSPVGIVPGDATGRRVFSGTSRFPALSFRCCSILTSITLIGSQDLDVKSRPNLFTHSSATDYLCVVTAINILHFQRLRIMDAESERVNSSCKMDDVNHKLQAVYLFSILHRNQISFPHNTRAGETGDLRENPPTSTFVRGDSHGRISGSDPAGNQTRLPLVEGECTSRYILEKHRTPPERLQKLQRCRIAPGNDGVGPVSLIRPTSSDVLAPHPAITRNLRGGGGGGTTCQSVGKRRLVFYAAGMRTLRHILSTLRSCGDRTFHPTELSVSSGRLNTRGHLFFREKKIDAEARLQYPLCTLAVFIRLLTACLCAETICYMSEPIRIKVFLVQNVRNSRADGCPSYRVRTPTILRLRKTLSAKVRRSRRFAFRVCAGGANSSYCPASVARELAASLFTSLILRAGYSHRALESTEAKQPPYSANSQSHAPAKLRQWRRQPIANREIFTTCIPQSGLSVSFFTLPILEDLTRRHSSIRCHNERVTHGRTRLRTPYTESHRNMYTVLGDSVPKHQT
ncbi:hypothetical protein PR048_030454 [Dryococelus australis]|uniref:Uncharacterized protein n=1 Tax=Dryococelus australis TaxID=614101 RepID=A0ABQ9G916_9NEOP|nr:hypothetical protein PR048_030454 [Dryococelus australis]